MFVQTVKRDAMLQVVAESLQEVLAMNGESVPDDLGETTVLVGDNAILDSLGIVSLIVEVEQRLEQEHNLVVTLASDKAMSQRNSPFRTVGVLADYICTLAEETNTP